MSKFSYIVEFNVVDDNVVTREALADWLRRGIAGERVWESALFSKGISTWRVLDDDTPKSKQAASVWEEKFCELLDYIHDYAVEHPEGLSDDFITAMVNAGMRDIRKRDLVVTISDCDGEFDYATVHLYGVPRNVTDDEVQEAAEAAVYIPRAEAEIDRSEFHGLAARIEVSVEDAYDPQIRVCVEEV